MSDFKFFGNMLCRADSNTFISVTLSGCRSLYEMEACEDTINADGEKCVMVILRRD